MPASSNPSQPAKPTRDPKPQPSRRRTRLRLAFLLGTGLVLAFLAAWMRPHLVDAFKTRSLLALDSIDPDTLESHLGEVPDAEATLETFWASGKISHRRAVLGYVTRPGAPTNGLRTRIVAKAMADADLDIRERAFGTLHTPDVTGLDQMIGPQLTDPDPEVRRLGIQTLRRVGHAGWTPAVRPLLSDPEPSLVLGADSLLRRWTGRDSGLRLADALPGQHGILPSDHALTPETRERLRGIEAYWAETLANASQPGPLVHPMTVPPPPRHAVDDFQLPDLQGRPRRLSEFRGRVVLLNFWATWCTPCAIEMPALTALQRAHTNDLIILGISLDSFQDGPLANSPEKPNAEADQPAALRRIVGSFAARQRVTYPILLDSTGAVARRFEGNELPTQVIIDPAGRLVRRFVGGRSPEAWAALIAWARKSPR